MVQWIGRNRSYRYAPITAVTVLIITRRPVRFIFVAFICIIVVVVVFVVSMTTTVAAITTASTDAHLIIQHKRLSVSFQYQPSLLLQRHAELSSQKRKILQQPKQKISRCWTKLAFVAGSNPSTASHTFMTSLLVGSERDGGSSTTSNDINFSSDGMRIDPLVLEFLYTNSNRSIALTELSSTSTLTHPTDTIFEISRGIQIWRRTLMKGQIPIPDIDFQGNTKTITNANDHYTTSTTTATTTTMTWPSDPILYQGIVQKIMIPYQLPHLIQRHPEMIHTVLRLVLSLYMDYSFIMMTNTNTTNESCIPPQVQDSIRTMIDNDHMDDEDDEDDTYVVQVFDQDDVGNVVEPSAVVTQIIRDNTYYQHLQKSVTMIQSLDQLFDVSTTNQLLLNPENDFFNNNQNNNDPMNAIATTNTNVLWHHTGWKILPTLQKQIQQLPKLKQLIQSLGRRSTTRSTQKSNRKYHKFRVRPYDANSITTSAYMDPIQSPRDYVSGLTRSNRYQDMLPTEAILLLSSSSSNSSTNGKITHHRQNSVLRSLFYSKIVESQLLSYEITGWTDAPTRLPTNKSRNKSPQYHRTPSAPGGPIIICLDTSYSMCDSNKESISKAIVLACVQAAHKQQRYCRVVAFGPKGTVIDAGDSIFRADAIGIQNLLNFLSNSFGGGTDVTGALKYAMTLLQPPSPTSDVIDDSNIDVYDMSAADLLLITDGEIPDPPVSDTMMEQMMKIRQESEVQIHGILVGNTKNNDDDGSKAIGTLEKICTHVHDFLVDYTVPNSDKSNNISQRQLDRNPRSVSALRMPSDSNYQNLSYGTALFNRWTVSDHRRLKRTRLFSRRSDDDDDDNEADLVSQFRYSDDSLELEDSRYTSNSMKVDRPRIMDRRVNGNADLKMTVLNMEPLNDYNSRVEHSVETIKNVVLSQLKEKEWKASVLEDELVSTGWTHQGQLREAIQRVGYSLIERDIEARLVVLGMLAGEHVLLIGPPGTAKSALGRRLSKICGGVFFQRLLTRFTTPEEIFGPLSLRALENDEYRRCTDGFLPKASVAFLDEIFKANSAILNTLLTILNERQFDNGAGLREECPIRCVIAASNELPESDELDALYDRFLLRKEVLPVSDDGVVQLLTTMATPQVSTSHSESHQSNEDSASTGSIVLTDGLDRICEALSQAVQLVQLDIDTSYLLRDLRTFLREEVNVDMSDRRLVKAAQLLKVSAATHGRTRVDPMDCLLLQHMAWNLPEQREMIVEWLLNHITPGTMSEGGSKITQYNILLNSVRQSAMTLIRRTSGDVTGASGASESDIAVISTIQLEISQLVSLLQTESNTLARHIELLRRSMSYLWIDPDQARSLQQQLIPIAEQAYDRNFRTLCHARALEALLMNDSETETVVSNDVRLSVMEQLWDDDDLVNGVLVSFTNDELNMSMREAKVKYADGDTFRRWKRERKKAGIK